MHGVEPVDGALILISSFIKPTIIFLAFRNNQMAVMRINAEGRRKRVDAEMERAKGS